MKERPFIYLASQSPRRADLMRELDIPFQVVPSRYIERPDAAIAPKDLIMQHSQGKARLAVIPPGTKIDETDFILGADTVVVFKEKCLGKPKDYGEAKEWLLQMSGKNNTVLTGLTLIHCQSKKEKSIYEETTVKFKDWSSEEIEKYIYEINALDKAGAYAIQSNPCIVDSYQGSYSNVIGLPKEALKKLLEEFFSDRQ